MLSKDFTSNHFRATINDGCFFVREIDENGCGGRVIEGIKKGRNWEEKMDKILSNCAGKRMTFSQTWDAVIGHCNDLSSNGH